MARKGMRLAMMLRVLNAASKEFEKVTSSYSELSFYWGAATAAQELARQGFLTEKQGDMIGRSIIKKLKGDQ